MHEKVRIALKDTTYRFQCLGCYQAFTSFTPFSAAFAQHVMDCVACPFPYDLPEEVEARLLSWRDRFLPFEDNVPITPEARIEWFWDMVGDAPYLNQ